MAEETKKVQKTADSKFTKFIKWCKKLPRRIATPFKNMWFELKKVTWPTKRKLMVYSVTVLVFMLVMGVIIGLLDTGASALIRLMI